MTDQSSSQSFPPGINRYMDMINMMDSSIEKVLFILDGDTVKKSAYSFTIAVKDVLNMTSKGPTTIFEDIKQFNETQDSNYDFSRLAMSESIRKNIRPRNLTNLKVDMEKSEYYNYKNDKMIIYHKFEAYNVKKN